MPDLLTTDEAAAYLRMSERKLYELVANGAVPCSKVTGRWLFPKAALLGYSDATGVAINDAMLGGGFIRRRHFFDRLPRGEITGDACVSAWMGAAQTGYAGISLADRFRAVSVGGQEWKLADGQIVRGRRY